MKNCGYEKCAKEFKDPGAYCSDRCWRDDKAEYAKKYPKDTRPLPFIITATGFNVGGIRIEDPSDLEGQLAKGMSNDMIEQMAESTSGEKILDKYINKKYTEGKRIEDETNGVFNRKLPNGNLSRTIQFDQATGTAAEL